MVMRGSTGTCDASGAVAAPLAAASCRPMAGVEGMAQRMATAASAARTGRRQVIQEYYGVRRSANRQRRVHRIEVIADIEPGAGAGDEDASVQTPAAVESGPSFDRDPAAGRQLVAEVDLAACERVRRRHLYPP